MKSDSITIDNHGNGFEDAVAETKKVAVFQRLNEQQSLRLQLITEEMLSMARSITGEMKASFWLENEGMAYELHLSTNAVLDRTMRDELLSAATSRKNDAAKSFLGWLRDMFEKAMIRDDSDANDSGETGNQMDYYGEEDPNWDGYERSVLRKLANRISISIRGGKVDMTVYKDMTA